MIIRANYVKTLGKLASIIDASDVCRRRHCYKVERLSLLICRGLDLSSRETKAIKIASILHDIGKIGIDLNLIKKPSRLTSDEWAQVRLHPDIGANIVRQLDFLREVTPIIKYHHARFNGGGYPDPDLRGRSIPVGARIIAVADAFDSMTSDRPYRKALSRDYAIEELKRCAGQQFDPEVVEAFVRKEKS